MKKLKNILQIKEHDKCLETDLNGMEISCLPSRELKLMVIKITTMVRNAKQEERIPTKKCKV